MLQDELISFHGYSDFSCTGLPSLHRIQVADIPLHGLVPLRLKYTSKGGEKFQVSIIVTESLKVSSTFTCLFLLSATKNGKPRNKILYEKGIKKTQNKSMETTVSRPGGSTWLEELRISSSLLLHNTCE